MVKAKSKTFLTTSNRTQDNLTRRWYSYIMSSGQRTQSTLDNGICFSSRMVRLYTLIFARCTAGKSSVDSFPPVRKLVDRGQGLLCIADRDASGTTWSIGPRVLNDCHSMRTVTLPYGHSTHEDFTDEMRHGLPYCGPSNDTMMYINSSVEQLRWRR